MKKRNDSIVLTIIGLFIILGVSVFVLFLFNGTKKEAEVVIEDNQIIITGQYGTTNEIANISDIQIVDSIPTIGKKVNGAGLGDIKKGDFNVEGLGTCRLFIHSNQGPFIYIIENEKYTIINFKDASKTTDVYEELKKALQ